MIETRNLVYVSVLFIVLIVPLLVFGFNTSMNVTLNYFKVENNIFSSNSNVKTSNLEQKQSKKRAICTLVTNGRYMMGFQTLAYSISKWRQNSTDLIALVLQRNLSLLTGEQLQDLSALGYKILEVPVIKQPKKSLYYRNQFTKLWLWNLTAYDTVMYFDGDFLTLKSFNDVFEHFEKSNATFGATKNWVKGKI